MENHKIIAEYLKSKGKITFGKLNDEAFIIKIPNTRASVSLTVLFAEKKTSKQNNSFSGGRLSYQKRSTQIYIFSSSLHKAKAKADSIYEELYKVTNINNKVFNIILDSPIYIGEQDNKDEVFMIDLDYNYTN